MSKAYIIGACRLATSRCSGWAESIRATAEPIFSTISTATIASYISSTGAAFPRVPPTSSYPVQLRGFITLYITPGFSFLLPSSSRPPSSSTSHQPSSSQPPSSCTSHQASSSGFYSSLPASSSGLSTIRKQCIVEGCPAHTAPSMWHNHMTLYAKGALPGIVPSKWLSEHNMFVCPSCSQQVANSRHASHLHQCSQRCIAPVSLQKRVSIPSSDASQDLPTFDQVCQLNHPNLRYIPAKARPAFARALSSSLRDVLQKNTEDAWLKLFMLPKCVLPSLRHKGNHNPHKSIEFLCNMWLNNDLTTLWMMAK